MQISDTEYGEQPHVNPKEAEPRRTTTRNVKRLTNDWTINIALEQKGPGISQPGSCDLPSGPSEEGMYIN